MEKTVSIHAVKVVSTKRATDIMELANTVYIYIYMGGWADG